MGGIFLYPDKSLTSGDRCGIMGYMPMISEVESYELRLKKLWDNTFSEVFSGTEDNLYLTDAGMQHRDATFAATLALLKEVLYEGKYI